MMNRARSSVGCFAFFLVDEVCLPGFFLSMIDLHNVYHPRSPAPADGKLSATRGLDAAVASGDTEVSKQQYFLCEQAETGQATMVSPVSSFTSSLSFQHLRE